MGAAAARLLADRGPLVVADIDGEAARVVAEKLNATAATVDVTDRDSIAALVDGIERFEALVVTAGLSPTMAGGRRIHEVNLIGLAQLLGAVQPRIGIDTVAVCFASVAAHAVPDLPDIDAVLDEPLHPDFFERLAATGLDPDDSAAAYALSKRGLIRLVRRSALPWGKEGARILSISPGIIDTPMGRLEDENQPVMAEMVAESPLGRTASPDEVAKVAAFLTSSDASYMTGCDVLVDGGIVAVTPRPIAGG